MNPQYSQPPQPTPNFPPQPNYNGNQLPPNSLPNQMAGLSLNNDFASAKASPRQMHAAPNQPPFGNLPPQAAYANKPVMAPPAAQQPQLQQQQQPNQALNNRPPMPPSNINPNPYAPPTANGAPQAQPPFNGSTSQFPPQPQAPLQQGPPNPQLPPQQNRPPSANPNFAHPPLPGQLSGQLPQANGPDSQLRQASQPLQQYPQASLQQQPQQPIAQPPLNQVPTNPMGAPPLPNQHYPPGPALVSPGAQQPPFAGNQQQPQYSNKMPPMPQYPQQQQPLQQMPPQPNYPQQPGYGPQGNMPPINRPQYTQPGPGQYNQPNQYPPGMAAPPPQRRLDPDQMPNPIQVMTENQRSITGPFVTNEIGAVPPLVTTKFITHDQGNSGPRFIRSTMYNVPATPDMIKQTSVPFSLIISPFAETGEGEIVPPIVDFGELGPIRCVRCKAYMSPNMQFVDAGRRFRCAMCKATTEVPSEYFQHLDHAGQRVDKYERPELVLGTYEFVATKEYCRENKPSKPPAFIFVIDVSYNNIKSGLVHLLCREMKNILKNLPIDQGHDRSKMKVGFITYNNSVHFYNCKENLAQPQMMVVGDIHEMFMPLLDGFFVDPEESGAVIDALMEQIPKMFGDTRETETILLPAIQAGLEAIKASECSGKLLVLHSSLPVSDAPGRLQNREDRKLLGTEKEKTILSPQNNAYNNLGQECVLAGCSVDLFIFNNSYIDLATIGQVSRLTGGEIYKYTYFQADIDGPRVISDLIKNVSRPIAFDAVMRVRTSAGIRPTEFYGHFFMSNTTDMDLASISSGKSIGIEIKHDDKLPPEENVYIQVALLFTSCSGQRRIRILNLAMKTCTQMADLFRCCDLDAVVLYFGKQLMTKLLDSTPRAVREALETRCAQILACYRKNCASPTSAGQLILPECMKLLPLYVSCMMKNDALSGGSDMSCDDRSYVMQFVQIMDLPMSVFYFYPRLIPIHDVNPNDTDIPAPIRCTVEKLADDGAYILENGVHLFVWIGLSLAPEFTQAVFSTQCSLQIDTDRPGLPVLDNPLSKRVRGIIDSIQAERPRCMRVTVVRSRDKLENVLRHYLIEDRSGNGMASYVDYLCHLHKEIRALLS